MASSRPLVSTCGGIGYGFFSTLPNTFLGFYLLDIMWLSFLYACVFWSKYLAVLIEKLFLRL